MTNLSQKFPECKFVKSISSVCIPNYPDKNLPTIFIYKAGEMKKQFVGPHEFGGMNLTQDCKYLLVEFIVLSGCQLGFKYWVHKVGNCKILGCPIFQWRP